MSQKYSDTLQVELDQELCRDVIENCADGVLIVDGAQRIAYANKSAGRMFGYLDGSFEGQPLSVLLPREYRAHHQGLVEGFRGSDERARYMEDRGNWIYGLRSDGTSFPVSVSILKSGSGRDKTLVAIIRDMSKQRALELELELLANTDALTGLLNRRAFLSRAEEERLRAGRYARPLAFGMIDIDHFKAVNDTYGHVVGDAALCHVAGVIARELRSSDLFARWGGEEFALTLPETDEAAALSLAQRLRCRIAEASFACPAASSQPVPLSISVGVAALECSDDGMDTLICRADRALYHAKRTGRNRVSAARELASA